MELNNSTPNNPKRNIRINIDELITPIISQRVTERNRIDAMSRDSAASSLGILEIDKLSDIGSDQNGPEILNDIQTKASDIYASAAFQSTQRLNDIRQRMQKALASKALGEIDKKGFDYQIKENMKIDLPQSRKSVDVSANNSNDPSRIPSYLLRPDDSLDMTLTNTFKAPLPPSRLINFNSSNASQKESKKLSSSSSKKQSVSSNCSFGSISLGEFRPADEAMSILDEQHWLQNEPSELKDFELKRLSDFSTEINPEQEISISSSKFGGDFKEYKGRKMTADEYFRFKSGLMMPIENPLPKSPNKSHSKTELEDLNCSMESVLSLTKISKMVSESSTRELIDELISKSESHDGNKRNPSKNVLKDRSSFNNIINQKQKGCPCHLRSSLQLTRSRSISPAPLIHHPTNSAHRKSRSVSPNHTYRFQIVPNRKQIESISIYDHKDKIPKDFRTSSQKFYSSVNEWIESSCNTSFQTNISEPAFDESELEDSWVFIPEQESKTIELDAPSFHDYLSIHNMTSRWLLCTITLDDYLGGDGSEIIKVPQQTVIFSPSSTKEAKITIFPSVYGHLDLTLKINIQDKVTKHVQVIFHRLRYIITERKEPPKSSVMKPETNNKKSSKSKKSFTTSIDSGRSSFDTHPSKSRSSQSTSYENNFISGDLNRARKKSTSASLQPRSSNASISSRHLHTSQKSIPEDLLIKIQSTASEVIWASIPVGLRKTEIIKMRHIGPLCKIQIRIFKDPTNSYSVLNEKGEWVTLYYFVQKESEISTVKFSLMPQRIGICSAFAQITAILNDKISTRTISLFGYGGESQLSLKWPLKDPSGGMYLKLGKLRVVERQRRLGTYLQVRNEGSIPAFFAITRIIPHLNSLSLSSLIVTPRNMILAPGFSQDIQIEYQLNRDDVKWISQSKEESTSIASLRIFYGDEPTRFRLCKLVEKYSDKEVPEKLKDLILNTEFSNEIQVLDPSMLNDPWSAVSNLSLSLKDRDIALLIEREPDERSLLVHAFDRTNENLLFKTLHEYVDDNESVLAETLPPTPQPKSQQVQMFQSSSRNFARRGPPIRVEPTMLIFSRLINYANLLLINTTNKMQSYEITSVDSDLFKYNSMGQIKPGEEFAILIKCERKPHGVYKTLITVSKILDVVSKAYPSH